MNKVFLIGNVGADPELKTTQSGLSILKMRLATTEKWTDGNGQKQERTDWHTCTMFGKRAEGLAPYITKGSKLLVEGGIKYSSYEDKEGNKRFFTEITISNIEFLNIKRNTDETRQPKHTDTTAEQYLDDALPF